MGTTGADGRIVFENLPAGTYRFRIERDSFVTLEKEIVVFAGGRTSTQAGLSAGAAAPAPAAPPPPPPPTPSMSTPVLKPGEPRILSLTDDNLIEKLLREKDPVAERQLGCSGATSSRLIRVNDSLAVHSHADADEVLYIFGGEVTLKLGDKEQNLAPGGFSLVPRGMAHAVTRRGRVPVVILSIVSGPPCQ
jgi:mannose-6-phosphate isomerase-like protein (cupin superfamily)